MDPLVDVPSYRWHFLLPYVLHNGRVTVDQGLGSAISIQLMVAADYIPIIDVQMDIHTKDQPPGMKGAEADIPLMKRFP